LVTGIKVNATARRREKEAGDHNRLGDSSISVTSTASSGSSGLLVCRRPLYRRPPGGRGADQPAPSTTACTTDDSKVVDFVAHAKDCNDFDVEGADIKMSAFDPRLRVSRFRALSIRDLLHEENGKTPDDISTIVS